MPKNIAAIQELRKKTGVGIMKCKDAVDRTDGDVEKAIELLRKEGVISALKKNDRPVTEATIVWFEDKRSIGLLEAVCETDFVSGNEEFLGKLTDVLKKTMNENLDFFGAEIEEYRVALVQCFGENIVFKEFIVWEKNLNCSYASYVHLRGSIGILVEISGSDSLQELAKSISLQIAGDAPEYIDKHRVPSHIKEKELEIAHAQAGDKAKNPYILQAMLEGKFKKFCELKCLVNQKYIRDNNITVQDVLKATGPNVKVTKFVRLVAGDNDS